MLPPHGQTPCCVVARCWLHPCPRGKFQAIFRDQPERDDSVAQPAGAVLGPSLRPFKGQKPSHVAPDARPTRFGNMLCELVPGTVYFSAERQRLPRGRSGRKSKLSPATPFAYSSRSST